MASSRPPDVTAPACAGDASIHAWVDTRLPCVFGIVIHGALPPGPTLVESGLVLCVERGRVQLSTPFGVLRLDEGMVGWIPDGVLYRQQVVRDEGIAIRACAVQRDAWRGWLAPSAREAAAGCIAAIPDPELAGRLTLALADSLAGRASAPSALRQCFEAVTHRAPAHARGKVAWNALPPEDDVASRDGTAIEEHRARCVAPIRALRATLDTQQGPPLSNRLLARKCGVTPEHMIREFKRAWWLTPHQWQMVHRALRAKRLIDAGADLASAAAEAGFADQSHLNRWFRRLYTIAPGRYVDVTATRIARAAGTAEPPVRTRAA